LNARDLDALMALYADDAVSMTNNAPMLAGKDAIRKSQEQEFAGMPEGLTYSFEVLDVYGDGNTVTETGKSPTRTPPAR
jgi:ketosteroid isomerase-like protein